MSMCAAYRDRSKRLMVLSIGFVTCLAQIGAAKEDPVRLVFACQANNDLFQTATACKVACVRTDDPLQAVDTARAGAGVLLLADDYPARLLDIPARVFETAARKKLRLYVEYPSSLPGLRVGAPTASSYKRAVVASDFFMPDLGRLRIMQLCGMKYVSVVAPESHIVAARVAGFDTAVHGLPTETSPLLFQLDPNTLVGATGFSHFLRARFAPQDALQAFWQRVLTWLAGRQVQPLQWQPAARASYGPEEDLPLDAQRQAVLRGAAWYERKRREGQVLTFNFCLGVYSADSCFSGPPLGET